MLPRLASHGTPMLMRLIDKKIDPAVWIHLVSRDDVLSAARRLVAAYPDKNSLPPLFGVPFNVKDSIDIAGLETTTACPPLAYVASKSARCYELVADQGTLLHMSFSICDVLLAYFASTVTDIICRRIALRQGQPRSVGHWTQWLQKSIRYNAFCIQRQTHLRRELER